MPERIKNVFCKFIIVALSLLVAGTSSGYYTETGTKAYGTSTVVDFEHNLDDYVPAKKSYNFYFTYKIVHPLVGCCCSWNGGCSEKISRKRRSHYI